MKLSSLTPLALALTATTQASYINYTTVTGYFLQDEDSTDASTFDYTTTNFGLINRTYPSDNTHNHHQDLTQWERFYHYSSSSAATAKDTTTPRKITTARLLGM
ncbi:hypothetical protein CBS147321_10731 [Aspergillus niger]|nr:hypothetical protein CBS133816_8637 [Aspergillus niger]KAI2852974.1 hypothetical protein CBS12448_8140 [Aspergillus niger]KAI2929844.1 hypothetical protein CBS147321_10731 [Aspergillus niger]KAI2937812.1 hypothetical protein CBS147322_10714 [Aspergillus niger]KAI2957728.1 hypothetical protein CBS147324_10683 [Aspergillus niger]